MASFVSLCNAALSHLGEYDYITSLDDDSPQAVVLKANYERVLEYCLRQHFWNFATKRVVLAPSASSPAWGAGKHFALPSDLLRIRDINNNPYEQFIVENNGIYWEGGDILNLRYVAYISDPNKFDSLFSEYYSFSLARNIAASLTDSREKMKEMKEMETLALSNARSVDGDEEGRQVIYSETFLAARF